ncbi:uncharacterized protein LOC130910834 [Corythoichthys intestinalis]|uniref:uncharacterized protein LOC130910834 n=1 Tax=Corythoichthys intestinalis TaxID=161448 RepID=UPI0025A604B3|nr:uncharacterized protein LOC130910834 [Corythoichthys intestinalis]
MPELKGLLQTTGQRITRAFQTDWCTRKDCLCGCPSKNRLCCFPCLFFSTCANVWTNTRYCDIKKLPRSLSKHESSTTHIQSLFALKTFGSSRIDLALTNSGSSTVASSKAKCLLTFLGELQDILIDREQQNLVPAQPPSIYVIIWDNIGFHRTNQIREWFNIHQQVLNVCLPPYTPFLNPIEELISSWPWKVYDREPYSGEPPQGHRPGL